jgi:hypothetical protein
LTYAANWDKYDQVSFWDELDFIGIQAYFPLTDQTNPSAEEIKKGWNPGGVDHRKGDLIQQLCLRIAFDEANDYEQVAGLFLWKWFPETEAFEHYEDYNLQRPEIKSLLKEMWRK